MFRNFNFIKNNIKISEALRYAPLNILESRILLSYVLKLSQVQLITATERLINTKEAHQFIALLKRRLCGEPIAYLIGEKEFFSLSLNITKDVLIPRPETELLVEVALEHLPKESQVLDMGTGSGAIAIALGYTRPDISITALDINLNAIQIAKKNAKKYAVNIKFIYSDWYTTLEHDKQSVFFDLILANPPYIAINDSYLRKKDLCFEPINALTDYSNGLSALYTIINSAKRYLKPTGWLLLEHGYNQANIIQRRLKQYNFLQIQSWRDISKIYRVSGGCI